MLNEVVGRRVEIGDSHPDRVLKGLEIQHAGSFLAFHPQAVIDGYDRESFLSKVIEVGLVSFGVPCSLLESPSKEENQAGSRQDGGRVARVNIHLQRFCLTRGKRTRFFQYRLGEEGKRKENSRDRKSGNNPFQ